MRKIILCLLLVSLGAPCLHATKAVFQLKSSSTVVDQVGAETLHGVESKDGKNRALIWEVVTVRYNQKEFDDFNSLASKAAAGRGDQLLTIADDMINRATKALPKDEKVKDALPFGTTEEEQNWIRLTSRYYRAVGQLQTGKFSDAQASFLDYMRDAEAYAATLKAGVKGMPGLIFIKLGAVGFDSPTGAKVPDASLLHRLYLDALEGLGDAYARAGQAEKANTEAYDRLVDLTTRLSANAQGRLEFYDWAVRALRAAANLNIQNKNYVGAQACYKRLETIASSKAASTGNKLSRELIEAQLNVGYMMIKDKKYNDALARFRTAVSNWENSRKSPGSPASDWITPDKAYQVAGSYLGLGMVASARAKDNANATADDWAQALNNYSNAVALFNAGEELRGSCLLYAAEAAAKMGEVALKKKDVALAKRNAETASTYIYELTENLKGTPAALDPDLAAVRKIIETINTAK
ncbi:MAG: hypothetical protein IT462_16705 [Planctomycetes bacterium]|nr:hypothetical protein [Planctomycetota bacterium]